MKICKSTGGKRNCVVMPTRLLFSKSILELGLRMGKRYSDIIPDLPPQAVEAFCDEIQRIKKKHGNWELIQMETADGEEVQVIL